MTRITNRPSTSCSDSGEQGRPLGAAFYPALWGRVLGGLLALGATAPLFAAPAPIETEFPDSEVLLTLPESTAPTNASADTAPELAQQLRTYLQKARSQGDPRFLGYAQRLLQSWPESGITPRLTLLRATLRQSLHRFDEARADLDRVLATDGHDQHTQALLTLANINIVQGRYEQARAACDRLNDDSAGIMAASCQAQVAARTGNAEAAYRDLRNRIDNQRREPSLTERVWAESILGDLAAQLGHPEAETHWRQVMELAPDDLYTRAQLADWLIRKQRYDAAAQLTEGYDSVDSLAVLRAIALNESGSPEAQPLIENLRERFSEAQWRGDFLHRRDYARFLLDIEHKPEKALTQARRNWQSQREPQDTRLVLRAASASDNDGVAAEINDWLAEHDQQDARYPEVQP